MFSQRLRDRTSATPATVESDFGSLDRGRTSLRLIWLNARSVDSIENSLASGEACCVSCENFALALASDAHASQFGAACVEPRESSELCEPSDEEYDSFDSPRVSVSGGDGEHSRC